MSEEFTTVFPPYYEGAEMSRGNAGWENPPYYLTAYGLAVKHGYTGTEEEWLASLKGDPGPGIVILGHYDTLAALEEAVTEPEDGDMYDVGSGASQLVYYWSDAQEDWLPLNVHGPQGETGPAGADGAPGVDGADGASAYEQAVEAGYSGTELEFMSLLADLPGYTEQARLWAVAAGEAESTAEGYKDAAAASAAEAASSVSGMVPNTRAVNGKALSSDVVLAASDVGAVPTTRKVNGKALSSNIVLLYYDVYAAAAEDLADEETGTTASQNYAEGDLLVYGGRFCTALEAIANGEAFEADTNVATTTVAEQFSLRDARISSLEDALDGLISRLGAM